MKKTFFVLFICTILFANNTSLFSQTQPPSGLNGKWIGRSESGLEQGSLTFTGSNVIIEGAGRFVANILSVNIIENNDSSTRRNYPNGYLIQYNLRGDVGSWQIFLHNDFQSFLFVFNNNISQAIIYDKDDRVNQASVNNSIFGGTWITSTNNGYFAYTFLPDGQYFGRDIIIVPESYQLGNWYSHNGTYEVINSSTIKFSAQVDGNTFNRYCRYQFIGNYLTIIYSADFERVFNLDTNSYENLNGNKYLMSTWNENDIVISFDNNRLIISNNNATNSFNFTVDGNFIVLSDGRLIWFYSSDNFLIIDINDGNSWIQYMGYKE